MLFSVQPLHLPSCDSSWPTGDASTQKPRRASSVASCWIVVTPNCLLKRATCLCTVLGEIPSSRAACAALRPRARRRTSGSWADAMSCSTGVAERTWTASSGVIGTSIIGTARDRHRSGTDCGLRIAHPGISAPLGASPLVKPWLIRHLSSCLLFQMGTRSTGGAIT